MSLLLCLVRLKALEARGIARSGSNSEKLKAANAALAEKRTSPAWLNRDLKNMTGTVQRLPERAEIDGNLNEQLIVEYYSR